MKIAIVYFSQTNNTHQLVRAAQNEISTHGGQCDIFRIIGRHIVDGRFTNQVLMQSLHDYHAIVFASPTYMGGVAAQFKAFADASSEFWSELKWADKFAAGITCGASVNGDQTVTLQYLNTFANQHGMLWVGLDATYHDKTKGVNRLGCHLGATACAIQDQLIDSDINTARYLGKRVFEICQMMQGVV